METRPDFEATYIDSEVQLVLAKKPKTQKPLNTTAESVAVEGKDSDPTYRVSKLAAANNEVVAVKPNDSLERVVTIMMARDFSQVPVMTSSRDVKGVVTWRSIGTRLALTEGGEQAKDHMEPAYEIRHSDSMFGLIGMIVQHDFVLVRDETQEISGIITGTDLSEQFQQISEPFLLLSEVENLLRLLIADKFEVDELRACKNEGDEKREIDSVADMNFGEYIRLLESGDHWKKFGVGIDRVAFCKGLDDVRQIRNYVMHFDPDGVPTEDIETLRDYTKFLRRLHQLVGAC